MMGMRWLKGEVESEGQEWKVGDRSDRESGGQVR